MYGYAKFMKKEIKFKLAELFCGPGGLALGALRSFAQNNQSLFKINSVWANDIDSDTCETYARNIHCGDQKKVICRAQKANGQTGSFWRFRGYQEWHPVEPCPWASAVASGVLF